MKDNITHKMICITNKKGRESLFFEESIKQIDFENKVLWLSTGVPIIFQTAKIEYHYPPDIKKMKICKKLD